MNNKITQEFIENFESSFKYDKHILFYQKYKLRLLLSYILGLISSIFIFNRNVYAYKVSDKVILPIPLAMSSAFRAKYPKIKASSENIDYIILRPESDRLLSGYKKKLLACNTNRKAFLAGRARFWNSSPKAYLKNCERLSKMKFYDLHWTNSKDFIDNYANEETIVIDMSIKDDLDMLYNAIGKTLTVVNDSESILKNAK